SRDRRRRRHGLHRRLHRAGRRARSAHRPARPGAGARALRVALHGLADGTRLSRGVPRARTAARAEGGMREELHAEATGGPVLIPGVVTLAASSRRTLKHGDSFAMFDELGDVTEMRHSPTGLFHYDTRFLSQLCFTIEGARPLVLGSTVQPDNLTLDVDMTNPDIFREERLVLPKDTFHIARAKFLWQGACYELFTITSYA